MLTVQNDWVEYETEPAPARRVVVRGGAACAQRALVTSTGAFAPAARPAAPRTALRPPVPRVATGAAAARPAKAAPLRLTSRGRFVLVVLPALLVLTGLVVAAPQVGGVVRPASSTTVVVGTADTLRSIAERRTPDADAGDTVAGLEQANRPADREIAAGQVQEAPEAR